VGRTHNLLSQPHESRSEQTHKISSLHLAPNVIVPTVGKMWIYRLKKEDFAHVALEGRLNDMRKALSEYYSETENDAQLVDIWAELEATYYDRAGPSIT